MKIRRAEREAEKQILYSGCCVYSVDREGEISQSIFADIVNIFASVEQENGASLNTLKVWSNKESDFFICFGDKRQSIETLSRLAEKDIDTAYISVRCKITGEQDDNLLFEVKSDGSIEVVYGFGEDSLDYEIELKLYMESILKKAFVHGKKKVAFGKLDWDDFAKRNKHNVFAEFSETGNDIDLVRFILSAKKRSLAATYRLLLDESHIGDSRAVYTDENIFRLLSEIITYGYACFWMNVKEKQEDESPLATLLVTPTSKSFLFMRRRDNIPLLEKVRDVISDCVDDTRWK